MCSIAFAAPPGLESLDDQALLAAVDRLHRLEGAVAAERMRCIAELERRQAWRGQGARSTADLLADRLHLTRGEARGQTETALALETLPEIAAGLRAGAIGIALARVVAQAARTVAPEVRPALDTEAARRGRDLNRRQLREHLDGWTQTNDPDALASGERRAWERRRVSIIADTPDGSVSVGGRLDPIGGATLMAALDTLARKTDSRDDRSYPQRLADALVHLARRALDAGDLPQVAAQRPHVILITTADGARLDGIGPVSDQTAELIGCGTGHVEVTVGRNGAVLDVGRRDGTPTKGQRLAIIARDRVCIGCGAPASRCQIHHVRWRSRGGPTAEPNLVLVCWGCHRKIHHHGWHVTRQGLRWSLSPPVRRRAG